MDIDDDASVGDEQSGPDEQSDSHDLMQNQHEEEWGGISGEQAATEATTYEHRTRTKPKKPPTGHELRAIKDATDLFKSGSFKLQVWHLFISPHPMFIIALRLMPCYLMFDQNYQECHLLSVFSLPCTHILWVFLQRFHDIHWRLLANY